MIKRTLLALAASAAIAIPASAVSYRGMIDIASTLDWPHDIGYYDGLIRKYGYECSYFAMSISTTHGLQLSKKQFVGIGAEYTYMIVDGYDLKTCNKNFGIPLYAMWRMDFFGRKWSPFFDVRGGYQIGKASGLYAAADIGVRMVINPRMGLNFSVGARGRRIYYKFTNPYWSSSYGESDGYYAMYVNTDCYGLTIRIGIDF